MIKLTDYVKIAEAAEILGVSQNTLRKWAAAGAIPVHRNPANGYRLFKRNDLETFLKKTAKPIRFFLFNNRAICAHLFDRSSFGFRNSDFGFAASPR